MGGGEVNEEDHSTTPRTAPLLRRWGACPFRPSLHVFAAGPGARGGEESQGTSRGRGILQKKLRKLPRATINLDLDPRKAKAQFEFEYVSKSHAGVEPVLFLEGLKLKTKTYK